jgi:prevent-host-death family protein
MEITAKELRGKPTQIIEQASRGTEVIITVHGKKLAKIIPYRMKERQKNESTDEIFGIWEDKDIGDSIDTYVRSMRKRRSI